MHIYRILHIILLTVVLTMVSCTSSDDIVPVTEPAAQPIIVGANGSIKFDADRFSRDGSTTPSTNPSAIPVMPPTCGVFGAMDDLLNYVVFDETQIFYYIDGDAYQDNLSALQISWTKIGISSWFNGNDWPYAPVKYWSPGKKYNFYCFAPHISYDNCQVEMSNNKYEGMKTFKFSHIPPYSNVTYCVSKAIRDNNYGTVPFEMKHLSARLCLNMKIGEQYARIRNIRVKEVTINDRGTDADFYKWEVDFTQNPYLYTLSTDGKYTPPTPTNTINIIPIFNDRAGLQLKDDEYQQFGSLYVMPQNVGTLRMNVTYDVYDKTDALVRENQTISNDIELHKDVVNGLYYDINILISPAYLYVLSDNDVAPDVLLDVPAPSNP